MKKPQSFEEVFKDAYDYWIDDANIHRYEGAKGLADQVWQHQQAKVEELQVQLKGAEERAQLTLKYKDKYREERDKLQKRVDAAIEAINEHYDSDGMSGSYFMDLKEILEGEQALKGESSHRVVEGPNPYTTFEDER